MKKSQKRQAAALIEIVKLTDRSKVPCIIWYNCAMKEPESFRRWRLYASLCYRVDLWREAGLPEWQGMAKMVSETRSLEREAYRDWLKLKRKISAEYVDGRRKTRPPWGIVR